MGPQQESTAFIRMQNRSPTAKVKQVSFVLGFELGDHGLTCNEHQTIDHALHEGLQYLMEIADHFPGARPVMSPTDFITSNVNSGDARGRHRQMRSYPLHYFGQT